MDQHPDTWTAEGVKGGLIGFYRSIAGVGLLFPRADHPIAVEFPGYPVVRLRLVTPSPVAHATSRGVKISGAA
jgi:hypothetical protein